MKRRILVIYLILVGLISIGGCSQENRNHSKKEIGTTEETEDINSYKEETQKLLRQILSKQKQQLIDYLEMTQKKARSVCNDELMNRFFKTKKEFYYLNQSIEMPSNLVKQTKELCNSIQEHYVRNYMIFYDILFIDTKGEIFYTIKKQKDYHKNIFSEEFKNTALSKMMRLNPEESFADFQFYEISGEPSAFFIETAKDSGETLGWFVFQFTINKINSLFSVDDGLGTTGEVLLVNKDHYMLTDSRFKAESTILKQKLADKNIDSKFAEGRGSKSVVDYRGNKVISVFEVFEFLGSEWLIIAKINENEAITNYYKNHKTALKNVLTEGFSISSNKTYNINIEFDQDKVVDMDEFQRANGKESLYTHGISTCTAVIISFPGKFAYLAHISPYDRIYGENKTDLLGQILKKISYLEILQSEKQELEFIVIAPHKKTLGKIVEILLKDGYFLDQIKFISHMDANEATVYYDTQTNVAMIQWKLSEKNFVLQKSPDFKTVGELFKKKLIR